jgi:hypothetical protein
MVTNRKYEGVLDPKLPEKPSSRALKKMLLVALRCVDPDSHKRPKMGHVVHMLEVDDFPYRDVSYSHRKMIFCFTFPYFIKKLLSFIYMIIANFFNANLFLQIV